MLIKIENTWHDTTEIVNADSLEEVKSNHLKNLQERAWECSASEVEEDWKEYYSTYEEARQTTYKGILDQFLSEVIYTVL